MGNNSIVVDTKIRTANTISRLQGAIKDKKMLTSIMSEILTSDTVVAEMMALSQNVEFSKLFPEFYMKNVYGESFINCQQNNKYHRYGVWKHTLVAIEVAAGPEKPFSDDQIRLIKWALLFHDLGKPFVKQIKEDGTESFADHGAKSSEIARYILSKFDFSQDEVDQICSLIEYHDVFLNINDVTFDNMLLLLEKMHNNKDLFYMLLELKEADAIAKNIHSYEIAKRVLGGFMQMSKDYFNERAIQKVGISKMESDQLVGKIDNVGYDPEAIVQSGRLDETDYTSASTHELMRDCIAQMCVKRDIDLLYQPVFDLKNVKVWGYETFSRNKSNPRLNITQIIAYSLEIEKFQKLQQAMFINAIERFSATDKKEVNRMFISVDLESFENYANKPRIYDMMDKTAVVVSLKNYQKMDTRKIQQAVDEIRRLGGKVMLNNFDGLTFKQHDLEKLNIDYLKFDISVFGDFFANEKKFKFLESLITLCFVKEIKLIVCGVESYPVFSFLKGKGIRFMQGYFLAKPQKDIVLWGEDIHALVNGAAADEIEKPKFQSTRQGSEYNPNDPNSHGGAYL